MSMNILYEDKALIVCQKPAGVLSEGEMPALLCEQLSLKECFVVHRLDREVGGVMVFAKTKKAAAALSKSVQDKTLKKEYLAIVEGEVTPEKGEMRDLLFRDAKKNKSFVVKRERKGVREAVLDYEVLEVRENDSGMVSLVKIRLQTGRTHQIRVQFSSRKHPLVGDSRYGSRIKRDIMLWSHRLTFPHPDTGEEMEFFLDAPW